jgi:hypothetical protein
VSDPIDAHGSVTVEVTLAGERARVELRFGGGEIEAVCSCGVPGCSHRREALRTMQDALQAKLLAPEPARLEAPRPRLPHATAIPQPPERRTLHPVQRPATPDTRALAEVLQDVVTAVVRSGVAQGASPSVEEALERLSHAAPTPLPAGIVRFRALLSRALAQHDAAATARALAGASLLATDLVEGGSSEAARRRKLSWLGADEGSKSTRLTDAHLLEIAREQLGPAQSSVERRYLVDIERGAIYCEERTAGTDGASLGPCPRVLTVFLAELEETAAPRRVRVLQYSVGLAIDPPAWGAVQQHACTDFGTLLPQACDALRQAPALADPFVVVAPASVSFDDAPLLRDAAGRPLLLTHPENPAALRYLERVARGSELRWVAGRLVELRGVLSLVPLAATALRHGRLCYAQI